MPESGNQDLTDIPVSQEIGAVEKELLVIKIPETKTRLTLADLLRHSHNWPGASLNQFRITLRRGISLVEDSYDPGDDSGKKVACQDFVFGNIYNEPWIVDYIEPWRNTDPANSLFKNTREFLTKRGYLPVVDQPMNGDVVTYGTYFNPSKSYPDYGATNHFGIYDEGQVISKWGVHSVFRHNIDLVPINFGNDVTFFRRASNDSNPNILK